MQCIHIFYEYEKNIWLIMLFYAYYIYFFNVGIDKTGKRFNKIR
jgi:hypothetical protein